MTFKSRRSFIGSGVCGAMSLTPVLNTLLNLKLANATGYRNESIDSNYRALVCIFLAGGNDSWNMLLPTDDALKVYHKSRGELSLVDKYSLLKLNHTANHLHPACTNIQSLYNQGKLSFVANVGTLIEPTSVKTYKSRTVRIPRSLFSHSDQQHQWQTSFPQSVVNTGWMGRATEVLLDFGTDENAVSPNISLSGNNMVQSCGRKKCFYSISSNGSIGIRGSWKKNAVTSMASSKTEESYTNIFEKLYANAVVDSMEAHKFFSEAYNAVELKSQFDRKNSIAASLEACARTIGAQDALGHRRQTFFLMIRGWDHHNQLIQRHESLLGRLDNAIGSFFSALNELKVADNVTVFTASDFGRALASNGDGSDHGWGGNQFAFGGAVRGGRVCGEYPLALETGSGLDVGKNGRLLPTMSTDEYFSSLLQWFGVEQSNLDFVLPNSGSFGAANSVDPIGLFG